MIPGKKEGDCSPRSLAEKIFSVPSETGDRGLSL